MSILFFSMDSLQYLSNLKANINVECVEVLQGNFSNVISSSLVKIFADSCVSLLLFIYCRSQRQYLVLKIIFPIAG